MNFGNIGVKKITVIQEMYLNFLMINIYLNALIVIMNSKVVYIISLVEVHAHIVVLLVKNYAIHLNVIFVLITHLHHVIFQNIGVIQITVILEM
jgi:hypothetical protein